MTSSAVAVSVVIPFYNEDASVWPLFERLLPVLDALQRAWEVICIDDGSRDNTLNALQQVRQRHSGVRIIKLSRNFGKEAAL